MIDKKSFEKIVSEARDTLVETYSPLAIYIFGSYAWGNPDEDSDLDLLVIVEDVGKNRHQALVKGHLALAKLGIPKDLLLLSKKEFDEDSQDITTIHYKIKRKGKQIYAKA